ncbi:hypothetical protein F4778DRAFT_514371 [Xylariomycetidae sp. FL2044]|nr:hypothetical protein F4778DRAFT_514371 [Xylariomycetidae sp. FL2044]
MCVDSSGNYQHVPVPQLASIVRDRALSPLQPACLLLGPWPRSLSGAGTLCRMTHGNEMNATSWTRDRHQATTSFLLGLIYVYVSCSPVGENVRPLILFKCTLVVDSNRYRQSVFLPPLSSPSAVPHLLLYELSTNLTSSPRLSAVADLELTTRHNGIRREAREGPAGSGRATPATRAHGRQQVAAGRRRRRGEEGIVHGTDGQELRKAGEGADRRGPQGQAGQRRTEGPDGRRLLRHVRLLRRYVISLPQLL